MANWDEGNPGDSDFVSQYPANARAARNAVKTNFGVDHREVNDADVGRHERVTLLEQVGDPATGAAKGALYGKAASGRTELFYRDSDGTVRQITANGALVLSNNNVVTVNITDLNVTTAKLANAAVTDAKLRNSAALSVMGRSANSTGSPADIAAGTDGHVLRRSGTTLAFGQVATAGIADNAVATAKIPNSAVTNAKLANMTQSTIKGRAAGAGTGAPVDLTASQARDAAGLGNIATRTLTISTSAPSGGSNGDLWFQREA